MSGYTKGPWHFYKPGGTAASNPSGAAFLIGPTRLYMDKVCGFAEDDARLIAAAPDLLEALIAMNAQLEADGYMGTAYGPLRLAAINAIAKALASNS